MKDDLRIWENRTLPAAEIEVCRMAEYEASAIARKDWEGPLWVWRNRDDY